MFVSAHEELIREVRTWMACCHFYLGAYEAAESELAEAKVNNPLANRIKFHLAYKKNDEKLLVTAHNS